MNGEELGRMKLSQTSLKKVPDMGRNGWTKGAGSLLGETGRRLLILAAGLFMACAETAAASPSRILATPSADVLEYGAARFDMETYSTFMKNSADGGWSMINYGATYGLIPYTFSKSFGIEIGLDYRDLNGSVPTAADSPLFLNFKFALREGALFSDYFPAIAVGFYDFGGKGDVTAANIMYLAASKSFFGSWRAGFGFYSGNSGVMVDETGQGSGSGPMGSVEYQLNNKWWFAADGLIGKSRYASMNLGAGYLLQPGVKMTVAYDMYSNANLKPTLSFQLLIDY